MNAIIDVAKSGGQPILSLPAGATLVRMEDLPAPYNLPRFVVRFDPDFDGEGPEAQLIRLVNEANRWVGWFAGPDRGLTWFENQLGASIYRVTPVLVRDQRPALESVGLLFDGSGHLIVPHAKCGEPARIAPADPEP